MEDRVLDYVLKHYVEDNELRITQGSKQDNNLNWIFTESPRVSVQDHSSQRETLYTHRKDVQRNIKTLRLSSEHERHRKTELAKTGSPAKNCGMNITWHLVLPPNLAYRMSGWPFAMHNPYNKHGGICFFFYVRLRSLLGVSIPILQLCFPKIDLVSLKLLDFFWTLPRGTI